jgi:Xaa-Pro aminopeptidase
MNEFRLRMSKLAHLKRKCSGILLYNADCWQNPNFFWLSNISINGWLWVPFKGKPRAFVSKMYRSEARRSWAKIEFTKEFKGILAALPRARIGVDALHMPATAFNKIRGRFRTKDISEDLELARSIKTPYEITQIRHACKVTADILRSLEISKNITEARLRADIEWEMAQRGLEPAFPTIVASGKHIAVPHHIPTKTPVQKSLLIDLGVRYNGYCSDVTRTFGSKYKPVIRKLIFETIEPLLKPGARCADICEAANKALGHNSKHFITGLGHGLGIAVHEDPSLRLKSEDILQAGNVITIEPGIYVPNGIRHENVYLITKRGAENLTDF